MGSGAKIFYFSGTGNCMFVAREIAGLLGGTAVNAAALMAQGCGGQDIELGSAEVVGIVFPVYAYVYPKMIEDLFVKGKLGAMPGKVFLVATYGSSTGLAVKRLASRLKKRAGLKADYYGKVLMPENYTAIFAPDSDEEVNRKMLAAKEECAKIAREVAQGEVSKPIASGPLGIIKSYVVGNIFYGFLKFSHLFFRADKKCTGCKVCAKVCPTGNIVFRDGRKKPKWRSKCTQCMACLNWCPMSAIQYSPLTKKRRRYHNPEATLRDMSMR